MGEEVAEVMPQVGDVFMIKVFPKDENEYIKRATVVNSYPEAKVVELEYDSYGSNDIMSLKTFKEKVLGGRVGRMVKKGFIFKVQVFVPD